MNVSKISNASPRPYMLKGLLSKVLRVHHPIYDTGALRGLKERLIKLNFGSTSSFYSQGGQDMYVDLLVSFETS